VCIFGLRRGVSCVCSDLIVLDELDDSCMFKVTIMADIAMNDQIDA